MTVLRRNRAAAWQIARAVGVVEQNDPSMLFMVIERFHEGRAADVYRRFRDRGRMAPAGVSYVASWVDLDFRRCFQVMEAADERQIADWADHWDDLIDFEVVPVRTSADAASAIAPRL